MPAVCVCVFVTLVPTKGRAESTCFPSLSPVLVQDLIMCCVPSSPRVASPSPSAHPNEPHVHLFSCFVIWALLLKHTGVWKGGNFKSGQSLTPCFCNGVVKKLALGSALEWKVWNWRFEWQSSSICEHVCPLKEMFDVNVVAVTYVSYTKLQLCEIAQPVFCCGGVWLLIHWCAQGKMYLIFASLIFWFV